MSGRQTAPASRFPKLLSIVNNDNSSTLVQRLATSAVDMIALRLASSRSLVPSVRVSRDPANLVRMFRTRTATATGLGGSSRMTLRQKLMQPTTGLPFAVGRGVVIGATAVGMGALAYYGSGLSDAQGAFERSLYVPATLVAS